MHQKDYNREIHCWVKVVNQDGEGVKGYKCEVVYSKGTRWLFSQPKTEIKIYHTGEDGFFEFYSKGWTETVYLGNGWNRHWSMNPANLINFQSWLVVYYSEMQAAISKNPHEWLGSKRNPYLLHVFSLGAPQKLLYSKATIKLENKEHYICIDILKGTTWESNSPEGDIAMAEYLIEIPDKYFPNIPMHQPAIDFIAGRNCELAFVQDVWGLQPPMDGYSKKVRWPEEWNTNREPLIDIRLYYRLIYLNNKPNLYGVLRLGPFMKLDNSVMECFTNLHGERNLYYKGYEGSRLNLSYPAIIQDFASPPIGR